VRDNGTWLIPSRTYPGRSRRAGATPDLRPSPQPVHASRCAAFHADLAGAYDFPTRQLLPITGLIAFYNEKVDTVIDGEALPRPVTHFG